MSQKTERKPKKTTDFWRACRFLYPYRVMVTVSILCAFVTGGIMTAGIGALFPILQVLTKDQTVSGWIDRTIVETRMGVTLSTDPGPMRIFRINPTGPTASTALRTGDEITFVGADPADGTSNQAIVQVTNGAAVPVTLKPLKFYWSWLRAGAARLPTHPVKALAVLFLIVAGMGAVGNVFRFCQEYYSDKASINTVNDVRKRMYDHVLHIPLGFFGTKGTSDVTSRLVQDCQGLQEGFKIVLGQGVQEPIKAGFAMITAMVIDWRLTLFIIACAPIMGITVKKFGKKMRRASRTALQTSSMMLGQIEGSLTGIRVVKGANAERFERRRYADIMQGLRREQLKMAHYEALSTPILETIAMWVAGAVLVFAAYLMFVQHSLETTSFFIIMTCLVSIGESLRRLGKLNSVIQRSSAAASRIFETMDVPTERPRSAELRRAASHADGHLINLPDISREVRFSGVSFAYPNTSSTAVEDVDLIVPRGKSVAIVGRNGSGKTTLLAMLPRFYDPSSGSISIDGVDIRNATLRSLRNQISIVTQDSVIFPGTIAENIAYGLPLASREEIESAAKRAFAHDFIMEKPLGYDAPLDGLGGQLSGGQKQRLNIARAILRKAPILILDEATSQVDAESEHLIQQAIESLMHERTTFVIAHRFSTITNADSIVVMDRGRIVGQGNHDELLKTCPTYLQLYERQLVGSAT